MLSEHDLKVLRFGLSQSKGIYFVQADTIADRRSFLSQIAGVPYTLLVWDTKDPIDAILEAGEAGRPVIALGDERLVGPEAIRWLQGLNTGRDKLQLLKVPLVFLMDKPLLLRVIEEGKDLWSWRSRAFWEEEVFGGGVLTPVVVEKQEVIEDDSIEGAYQALGSKDLKWYVDPGEVGWGKIIKKTIERFRLDKEASVVWTHVTGVGAGMALQKFMFEMETRKIAALIKIDLDRKLYPRHMLMHAPRYREDINSWTTDRAKEGLVRWGLENNIDIDEKFNFSRESLHALNDLITKKMLYKNGFILVFDCKLDNDDFSGILFGQIDIISEMLPLKLILINFSCREWFVKPNYKYIYDFAPLDHSVLSINFKEHLLYKRHLSHKIEPQAMDRLIEAADGCIGILLSLAKEAVFECIVDERQVVILKDVEIAIEARIQWMKVREPPTWPEIDKRLVDEGLLLKTKEGNWRPHYLLNAAFPDSFKNLPLTNEISLAGDEDIPF